MEQRKRSPTFWVSFLRRAPLSTGVQQGAGRACT